MQIPSKIWGETPPSLIIFDLDGTLVNSIDDLVSSINFMRSEFGLNILTLEEVRQAIGKGVRHLVSRCIPENKHDQLDKALNLFLRHNEENMAVNSTLYTGVTELLTALCSFNIPLAVVSNKNTAHSKLLLSKFAIADFFTLIIGGDTFLTCKPSPEPLLKTVDSIGADLSSTIMIGDSINDFQAASSAGIVSIGCNFGYGYQWELETANFRIDSMNDLLPLPFKP